MTVLVYVIGVPAAGKSTLMRNLLSPYRSYPQLRPIAHTLYSLDGDIVAAQLGAGHPLFPGTDRLAFDVAPKALRFVQNPPAAVVLGEGDRLATMKWLLSAAETIEVRVVYLCPDPSTVQRQREGREARPDERWLASRATKVDRIGSAWEGPILRVSDSGESSVAAVRKFAGLA